jgi:prepilin-type N-terminal cleavage/methylation domain-containing protein
MPANGGERGFTLIEVLLATALFVVVAYAAFEVLRLLGAGVALLAQRGSARAELAAAIGRLRSDAVAAEAIWKPASACGDAIALLQRDAAGTRFVLYERRGDALVRSSGPAPLDPCDATLPADAIVRTLSGFQVASVSATALPAHADALTGSVDGGLLLAAGITDVAVDAHVRDVDGTPIRGGNGLVEVTLTADPRVSVVDLVAGSRPSAYTYVLAYTCGGRCAANGPFPEIRGIGVAACTAGIDFQNAPAYYVPAALGTQAGPGGAVFRVTSYWVTGAYTFTFGGAGAPVARRAWTPAVWPPNGATVNDPYPVDYANNAIAASAPAQIASDLGEPAAFAAELAGCGAFAGEATFAN